MDHYRSRSQFNDHASSNGILTIDPEVLLKAALRVFLVHQSIDPRCRDMKNNVNGIDKQLLTKIIRDAKTQKQPEPKKESPVEPAKPQPQSDEPRDPPIFTINTGAVVTRIWGRANVLGQVSWSVDQRRYRSDGVGGASLQVVLSRSTDRCDGRTQASKQMDQED